jgi:hypothetical protein
MFLQKFCISELIVWFIALKMCHQMHMAKFEETHG